MPIIPTAEPRSLTAGETALWQRVLTPDFPAPTWTLNYHLVGPTRINITAGNNGTAHEVNVNTATTSNWKEGNYAVHARVSDGTTTLAVPVLFPVIEIRLDPATADIPPLTDVRSWAAQTLAAVEAAIKSLAAKTVSQTTINGTTYTLVDLDKLIKLRAQLLAEVRAETSAAGTGRLVYSVFTRPV